MNTEAYSFFPEDGLTWRYRWVETAGDFGPVERGEVSDDGVHWFPATATYSDHLAGA